ncbi:MAG TPA: DUF2254 domain-containing protein [Gemmatimonadaceae bacterium]|nr:DUF2254 domain-containing protein [Gemmatimonadaceae bacterium]
MPYASRLKIGERLATSLWFVPTLFVVAAALLAAVTLAADRALVAAGAQRHLPDLFAVGPTSARTVLFVVAGSMIGTMGTVLSMTVITLSLASTQFTPRALSTFTRDRGTQAVIGVFTAAFIYCLVVVRTVRDGNEPAGAFVPTLSVATAVLLGLAGVAALIYFTHHVATSINVATVVAKLATTTWPLLDDLFPDGAGTALAAGDDDGAASIVARLAFRPVASHGTGYVQAIDAARLIGIAEREGLVVRLDRAVGEFVAEGDALAAVATADGDARNGARDKGARDDDARGYSATARLDLAINDCIALGGARTLQADPELGVHQIADIAVKALSPGGADPTTALACLDYLSTLLRRVAARDDPSPYRAGADRRLRLIARGPTFETMVVRTVEHLRQHLMGDAAATLRLFDALRGVALATTAPERHAHVWRLVSRLAATADGAITGPSDRAAVNERIGALASLLGRDATTLLLAVDAEREPATFEPPRGVVPGGDPNRADPPSTSDDLRIVAGEG